jgi:hypothetical protein
MLNRGCGMARFSGSLLAFLAGVLTFCAGAAWASPLPMTLPVQGVLRTLAGGPVADGTYPLTISLYDQAVGGNKIWSQTLPGVTVLGGLFAVDVGGDTLDPLPIALTGSNAPLWFGIRVGSDNELPRTAIGWVPRAMWANVAGSANSLNCSGCITGAQIGNGAITSDQVAFNYAASISTGGPATSALTASSADVAASAATAGSADVAKDLSCTSCVALAELATDVKAAFLPITGGTLTGELFAPKATVTGTLTVEKILDLTGAIVLGGKFGPGQADLCNVANAGAFTWENGRFSICDGSILHKLSFCTDQCQDASKIACGAAIPDMCGDTASGCAGKGTLCNTAGQQCTATGCQAIPSSCLAIAATKAGTPDAAYLIDPDGIGGEAPFLAWCDLNTDTSTDGSKGGWTLVMKVDGSKDTFLYDSAYWTNRVAYNPGAYPFDTNELKSSAFWTLRFTSIRLLMSSGGNLVAPGQEIEVDGPSLFDIFASGAYRPTYLGRANWKALLPNTALQNNCNLEGFNVRPQSNEASKSVYPRVRLGVIANDTADCIQVDSFIGVGEQGTGCFAKATQKAAGNGCDQGCGGCDNGVGANPVGFAYIYVR